MPLKGFAGKIDNSLRNVQVAASLTPFTPGEVLGVAVSGGPQGGLTGNLLNSLGHRLGTPDYWADGSLSPMAPAPTLSPAEANARYGIPGHLDFKEPVTEYDAAWKQQNKQGELYKTEVLSRSDSVNGAEKFTASLGGGIIDPVSLALNFVPVAGEVNDARFLGMTGLAAKMARGAWVNGGIGAGIATTEYGLGQYQGLDYTPQDAGMSILSSAVFGAGLEGIGYGVGKLLTPRGASGAVPDMIRAAASAQGVDPEAAVRIAGIETGGRFNADAQNPGSSAGGIFQFTDGTWNAMGGGDKFDAKLNIERGVQLMAQNRDALRSALGREPTAGELYLAHQQGAGGAVALLRDPSRLAVDVVGHAEVVKNGGTADMTAGQFAAMWEGKMEGGGLQSKSPPSGQEAGFPPPQEAAGGYNVLQPAISAMDEIDRAGVVAKAVRDMAAGDHVDIGDLVQQAADHPRAGDYLNEVSGEPTIPSARLHDDGVAVTMRGTEVPVRFAVVEARDLVTSHDNDLVRNPDYPPELQPRFRDATGAQADLLQIEKVFNAKLAMRDVTASGGAPVVAPDGTVESGNGRTILLRRNYERGTALADDYRAELERQGFDVSGMDQPVLVRVRTQVMDGSARVKLSREMNGETTARMSPTEQALVDAEQLTPEDIGLYQGGAIHEAKNAGFLRAFIDKAAQGSKGEMLDEKTGHLTEKGLDRVHAALVAKAYGSRSLVRAIFDTSNATIKTFGKALSEAGATWARMRGMAERGELAEGADTTQALVEALDFVRHVRDNRLNMGDLVEKWRDQPDMFAGDALSIEAQEYLKLFFKDRPKVGRFADLPTDVKKGAKWRVTDDGERSGSYDWTGKEWKPVPDDRYSVQRAADKIAADLRDIAEGAMLSTPEPDLFGHAEAFDVGAQIERVRQRAGEDEVNDVELNTSDGPAGDGGWLPADRGAGGEASLPGHVDLASPPIGEKAGSGGGAARSRPEGVQTGEAAGPGDAPGIIDRLIAGDPELKALSEEIERLRATDPAALNDVPAFDKPDRLEAAINAAKACLIKGEG